MRRGSQFIVVCAMALAMLLAGPAYASSGLSERAAMRALRGDLSRSYGITHVHASCHRKTRIKLSCNWRGSRADGDYRGRATVRRASGRTSVTLSNVRKV